MTWIRDEEFIRGDIPMTKFNIRMLTIGYLDIKEGDKFLDIGGGTGSVSIQAALHKADVWTIEREEEGVKLIEKNKDKFKINLNIIKGSAPKDLPEILFDKCFVGGSGGKLEEIFVYLNKNLKRDGIVCANFIKLDNLYKFNQLMKENGYEEIETQLIQASFIDHIGLLRSHNPIFITKGVKKND